MSDYSEICLKTFLKDQKKLFDEPVAENLEEARLLVTSGQGFMPVEGNSQTVNFGTSVCRIPLYRGEEQITRKYCLFWKKDNSGYYIEEFADILKQKFV